MQGKKQYQEKNSDRRIINMTKAKIGYVVFYRI